MYFDIIGKVSKLIHNIKSRNYNHYLWFIYLTINYFCKVIIIAGVVSCILHSHSLSDFITQLLVYISCFMFQFQLKLSNDGSGVGAGLVAAISTRQIAVSRG